MLSALKTSKRLLLSVGLDTDMDLNLVHAVESNESNELLPCHLSRFCDTVAVIGSQLTSLIIKQKRNKNDASSSSKVSSDIIFQ